MYVLEIHTDAEDDLRRVLASDPDTAAELLVFLEELQNDQDLLDRLSQNGYSFEGGHWLDNVSVQAVVSQQRSGRNIWRVKLWDLEREGIRYRIIYAFEPQAKTYYVLAVVPRNEYDYEPEHPITNRVLRAYGSL